MSTTTTTTTKAPSRPSGRHPVNVGQLVMGIAFLGMVGVWALLQGDVVANDDVRWLLPLPWVLAGLGGLAALALTGSRRWGTRQTGWVGTDPAGPQAGPTTTDSTTDSTTDAGSPGDTDTTVAETDPVEPLDDTTEEDR